MSAKSIRESGMTFLVNDERCFLIEKCATVKRINKNSKNAEGVQIAEFLLLILENELPTIWIIEAKSSSPQPGNEIDFDSYIDEIRNKLSNSLSLFFALYLKRHPASESELPENFQQKNISVANFNLVLIIKDHKDEWLTPIREALSKKLKPTLKIWGLLPTSVKVLNDNNARELRLIQ